MCTCENWICISWCSWTRTYMDMQKYIKLGARAGRVCLTHASNLLSFSCPYSSCMLPAFVSVVNHGVMTDRRLLMYQANGGACVVVHA